MAVTKEEKVKKVAKPKVEKVKKAPAHKAAAVKSVKTKEVEKVHPVKSSEGEISQNEIISRGKEKVAHAKIEKKTTEKYFYAVGRRKSAVAQVRLFENDKATDADLIINGKKMKDYFPTINLQSSMLLPLKSVGMQGKVRMTVLVRGGGVTGQVEAVRLGIARALVVMDETLKKSLKDIGLMTRDSRKVERKKPGLKKARKAPQWAKR